MSKINIEKDPDAFAETIVRTPGTQLLLGLDLGTTTGYAYRFVKDGKVVTSDNEVAMGQWNLSAGPYDSGAIRFIRLRHFLSIVQPNLVVFEDVKYTPESRGNKFTVAAIISRAATSAELFGAFKATVCTWGEENSVACQGFGIGSIKKHATGKGNSNKVAMIEACNDKYGTDFDTHDYESTGVDNIADAAFVLDLGLELCGKGL